MRRSFAIVLALTLLLALALAGVAHAVVGVDPAVVHEEMAPGDSITITKTATTPEIPPLPDVYFLADTTGSMGSDRQRPGERRHHSGQYPDRRPHGHVRSRELQGLPA